MDKKSFLVSGIKTKSYKIFWKVSYKCNYRCSYCILKELNFRSNDEEAVYNVIAPRIKKIIENIPEDVELEITGGEPTLFDCKRLLKDIAPLENLKIIHFNTNGWRPVEWFEDLINFLYKNNVIVSLNTSIHEEFCGNLDETLEKFLQIQNLSNVCATASFVKTSTNKTEETIIDKFIEKHPTFRCTKTVDYNEGINKK